MGAVADPHSPDDDSSTTVAWHYGDPLGEQRAAVRGAVIVDRSDRSVIEVPGPERLTWLHNISSQDLRQPVSYTHLTLPTKRIV